MTQGGEVKGKLANGLGIQYPSHYLGTCVPSIITADAQTWLPVVDWTEAPADLNGLVRFAERRNLVSARVPSHFNWPLLRNMHWCKTQEAIHLWQTLLIKIVTPSYTELYLRRYIFDQL